MLLVVLLQNNSSFSRSI